MQGVLTVEENKNVPKPTRRWIDLRHNVEMQNRILS